MTPNAAERRASVPEVAIYNAEALGIEERAHLLALAERDGFPLVLVDGAPPAGAKGMRVVRDGEHFDIGKIEPEPSLLLAPGTQRPRVRRSEDGYIHDPVAYQKAEEKRSRRAGKRLAARDAGACR